jgi:hypothetical protein
MAESSKPLPIVRTFLTDMPAVTTTAALTLVERRAAALADTCRSVLEVRQPTELLAVQMNYWSQLLDDYQDAYAQGLAQLAAPTPAQAVKDHGPSPVSQPA